MKKGTKINKFNKVVGYKVTYKKIRFHILAVNN